MFKTSIYSWELLILTFVNNTLFTTICSQLFVHNFCSHLSLQFLFTKLVHKSCSQLLFITFVQNIFAQILLMIFQNFCSQILFTTFVHSFFSQLLFKTFILEIFKTQLLYVDIFQSHFFFKSFVYSFCSQLLLQLLLTRRRRRWKEEPTPSF